VNYYRRYMGDYNSKTAALSLAEHGVYNILLDTCYSTEKPLPPSIDALCRICRAMSKVEQEAVKSVANSFFPIGTDGFRHNRRADEEITKAQATIAKQRDSGAESAAKRWSTHESTDNLTGKSTDRSTHESTDNLTGKSTDRSTHESTDGSTGGSAIQPPTTNHQPPSVSLQPPTTNQGQKREAARSAHASRLTLGELPDEWRSYCKTARPDLNPDRVFENFFDYWTAKPGKEGVKADWAATWRMWVRKEAQGKAGNGEGDGLLQRNLRAVGLA
jgi:uncharacterized protein YdaU (DUF1376 family)